MWEGEPLARMGSDRDLPNVSSPLRTHRDLSERWGGASGGGPTAAPLPAVGTARCWAARSLPDARDPAEGRLSGTHACAAWADVAACKHIGRASELRLRDPLPGIVPRWGGPAGRIDAASGIDGSGAGARVGVDRQMSFPLARARRAACHRVSFPWARRVGHGAAGEHGRTRR